VNISKRNPDIQQTVFIKHCPECNTPLVRKSGEAAWYCPNEKDCPPQIKGKLEHFISRKAMNIESLGEGRIELLFDQGLVKNAADLYELNYDTLIGLEKIYEATLEKKERKLSFRDKSVKNIINAIEASKKTPFPRVLFALGIRYVGETVAKKLALHYRSIEKLMNAGFYELVLVDDVGEKIAQSIVNYFMDDDKKILLSRLIDKGLNFSMGNDEIPAKNNTLKGKSFVVSGVFSQYSRNGIKAAIEENGGRNTSSLSSKTDFLLAGENMGPKKREQASKIGIPIISEEDFIKMISTKEDS
jgi:DNA ligase (NAD+)